MDTLLSLHQILSCKLSDTFNVNHIIVTMVTMILIEKILWFTRVSTSNFAKDSSKFKSLFCSCNKIYELILSYTHLHR